MQFNGSDTPPQYEPKSVPKTSTLGIKTTIDTEYLLLSNACSSPFGRRADCPSKHISFVEDEEREPHDGLEHLEQSFRQPCLPKSQPMSAKKAVVAATVSPLPTREVSRGTIIDCFLSVEVCPCGYEETPPAASSVKSNE